jgi:dTDP-4-dehydrorhamnose reductase
MKILLFGKNGQVGWELQRSLALLGEIIALDFSSQEYCGDFTLPEEIAKTIRAINPDIIVNAAAHTAVDKAESEPDLARQLNALTPGILAEEARRLNAWLVHYSTDYVFDGSGNTPWQECDSTGPLSVYGQTKLEGEVAIQDSGCKHLIFRTSWVYASRGGNFARTMLRLARERDHLSVISDQSGAPTGADLIADVTAHALRTATLNPEVSGLYHLVASGETSWHGYAALVINYALKSGQPLKITPEHIQAIPTSAYPTPAKRPHNSRLDTTKLRETFGLQLPHWETGVVRMLTEILEDRS